MNLIFREKNKNIDYPPPPQIWSPLRQVSCVSFRELRSAIGVKAELGAGVEHWGRKWTWFGLNYTSTSLYRCDSLGRSFHMIATRTTANPETFPTCVLSLTKIRYEKMILMLECTYFRIDASRIHQRCQDIQFERREEHPRSTCSFVAYWCFKKKRIVLLMF